MKLNFLNTLIDTLLARAFDKYLPSSIEWEITFSGTS